jgi:predicted TIM-barrel fold metal-dependent hydrolase
MPARMIDAHHHLFNLEESPYPWLQVEEPPDIFVGDLSPVMKTYDIEDYLADCLPYDVQKSVHVEVGWDSSDPVGETRWLQGVADRHGFPHGIVASAELHEEGVAEVLDGHCASANMRGVRQLLLSHTDPRYNLCPRSDLLTDRQWRVGFALLERHGLSFDLQVYPHQMAAAAEVAAAFPGTQIILDHAGLPIERESGGLERWRAGMTGLAAHPNVVVKISGLGQVDHHWTLESIRPIVAETIELFGVDRCLFASNFPIDSLYSDYGTVISSFESIVSGLGLSEAESDALFYTNAERVYRL